jgi:hypothetical protein
MIERIEADVLIPGRGEPMSNGVVIIDGPVISFAGPANDAPETPGATVVRAPVVMPVPSFPPPAGTVTCTAIRCRGWRT